jgi:two-component system torCAD operon response regulator TorR
MTVIAAHIVVIEDDPVTRTALGGYLETFGYRVTTCAGAEAGSFCCRGEPMMLTA